MREFWNKITGLIVRLHKTRATREERRQKPRFICRCEVHWETSTAHGKGELRELSHTGMRLRTDCALLAGRHIRIRPALADDRSALTIDVALGTVVYSKARRGRYDIGVELLAPDRFSRFAWFHQLRRDPQTHTSPLPSITSGSHRPRLRVVTTTPPKGPRKT